MGSYSTERMFDYIIQCDNYDDFRKNVLAVLEDQKVQWKNQINAVVSNSPYTKKEFAGLCQVSRMTLQKWCEGAVPQNREMFIRIGFAANFTLEEMNHFLRRYGKYSVLYPKSLEDSVYIYVLSSETIPHQYKICEEMIAQLKKEIQEETTEDSRSAVYETGQMLAQLMDIKTKEEMAFFIQSHKEAYKTAYRNFYHYVIMYIRLNSRNVTDGRPYSLNLLTEGWPSSLRKCLYAIENQKWYPMRRKVISLGLHLNMDLDQINDMLCLAKMEPLCAKNPAESAVIYALEDAKLNDMIFCDGSDALYEYVRKILTDLGMPDAEEL